VQSTEAEAATYDPRDQYMPYFLAGDPTMSDEKAAALLHHGQHHLPFAKILRGIQLGELTILSRCSASTSDGT